MTFHRHASKEVVADGAQGVVFGRNALQVYDPLRFQAALIEVVKHGAQPEEALARAGLGA